MAAEIEIVLAHYWGEHKPGERLELDAAEARRLVGAGYAVYATKTAAKEAGDEEAPTASSRKSGR